jgi:thiol-disulfide isomerase/thioredoxin
MMLKRTAKILAVVLFIVVAGLATRHYLLNPVLESSSTSTEALFSAQLPDPQGQAQRLSQWKGKIVVVNFWASWCVPCREEMPELSELHERYRANDVVVIGISTDELDKMQAFSQEVPVKYPLLAGDYDAIKLSELLGNDKGVLPYTLIIGKDGSIVKTYFGRVSQALLEETLIPLFSRK